MQFLLLIVSFLFISLANAATVTVGVDNFFAKRLDEKWLAGKKVGLITNYTAINRSWVSTLDLFRQKNRPFELVALFAPEHGLFGDHYASEVIQDEKLDGIPIFSLHGATRRPTKEMLSGIDVLVFDIQDVGSRVYTYISTLFYCMEEAGRHKIAFIVLDRPNPMGGLIVDGPIVEPKWRSFVGCAELPYCHGMTVAELARFFNAEYGLGVDLKTVSLEGWRREMTFQETGLPWVPTSPHIPESDTPLYYPATGLLGELLPLSIGVGYTLPFKVCGAPWIVAEEFARKMNDQNLPGIVFRPFYFRPFFDRYKGESCEGVLLCITDPARYQPLTVQMTLCAVLKSLYPARFQEGIEQLKQSKGRLEMAYKLSGTQELVQLLEHEKYFVWKLRKRFAEDREHFLNVRKPYLDSAY